MLLICPTIAQTQKAWVLYVPSLHFLAVMPQPSGHRILTIDALCIAEIQAKHAYFRWFQTFGLMSNGLMKYLSH